MSRSRKSNYCYIHDCQKEVKDGEDFCPECLETKAEDIRNQHFENKIREEF